MTRRRWVLLGVAMLILGWILGGEWVSIHQRVPENHLVDALGGLAFLVAGVLALDRRPGNVIGGLMLALATVPYLGNWSNLPGVAVIPMLAAVAGQFTPPLLSHIALAYPSGRLRNRYDRAVLAVIYAVPVAVGIAIALTFDPRAAGCACGWEPAAFPDPTGAVTRTAITVSERSALVLAPLFLIAVGRHWRRASHAERRLLTPLWIAVVILALVYVAGAFASPDPADPFAYFIWELLSLLQIALPVIFVWGLLSTRLARSAVGDLVVDLERSLPPDELRAALVRTLGDPNLDLLYPMGERWIDVAGQARSLHSGQSRTVIERDGRPVAALVHDPALDPGLVRATAAAAAMTMENARLQAEVRAQLEQVRASRQRIVEAADRERRRVERNIHDGAQQRLVTLALTLAMLREQARDPARAGSLEAELAEASAELKGAIEELRELARGIHPAILTEEGLPAAVEALADRSPLPIRVQADFQDRLPEPIEAIGYFVVAEALANAAKYSNATTIHIVLSRTPRSLTVDVRDDGVGGADPARGTGLRGLDDRVSAVRGALRVHTAAGGGTTVRAEIPCDV